MLIKRIVLEDFGLFRGRNELDLAPRTRYRHRRPVILIGGKNGSGKTTLLDALRFALYGPMALGTRVSVREYEAFLADRIHRAGDALFQPTSAAVGIEFEYAQAGVVATYAVERRWDQTEKGVRVNLAVTRDGQPLDELDREHADDFLRDLIPPGVSQLFFFDGEKIQQLADGEHDHLALAEAVRGLIGLDHVERLRGDLRIYAGKQPDASAAGPLTAELAGYAQEKERLDARRLELVREADQSEANLDRVRQELAREEGRLAQAGGVFASRAPLRPIAPRRASRTPSCRPAPNRGRPRHLTVKPRQRVGPVLLLRPPEPANLVQLGVEDCSAARWLNQRGRTRRFGAWRFSPTVSFSQRRASGAKRYVLDQAK